MGDELKFSDIADRLRHVGEQVDEVLAFSEVTPQQRNFLCMLPDLSLLAESLASLEAVLEDRDRVINLVNAAYSVAHMANHLQFEVCYDAKDHLIQNCMDVLNYAPPQE